MLITVQSMNGTHTNCKTRALGFRDAACVGPPLQEPGVKDETRPHASWDKDGVPDHHSLPWM